MPGPCYQALGPYLVVVDDEQVSVRDVLEAHDLDVLLRDVRRRAQLVTLVHLDVVERLGAPTCQSESQPRLSMR